MPPTGTAGTNPSQPPSTAGGAGAGGCGAGSTTCNGSCSQLAWDPSNCGSCGNACPSPPNGTPGCILGICLTTCEGSRTLCTNECLDTQNDDKNCGGCNAVCGLAQRCVAGSCALLGQTGSGPVNVLGLQLLLSTLNLPVAVLATVLGIDPKDVGAAKISYDDLIEAGITRKQLDEQGITLDELESVGIDVSAERKRRSP